MISPFDIPVGPPAATVVQMRDYFDKHCLEGRGSHVVEMRGFYWVCPPTGETHDDGELRVFVRGFN